jgi:hypothetical protein
MRNAGIVTASYAVLPKVKRGGRRVKLGELTCYCVLVTLHICWRNVKCCLTGLINFFGDSHEGIVPVHV